MAHLNLAPRRRIRGALPLHPTRLQGVVLMRRKKTFYLLSQRNICWGYEM